MFVKITRLKLEIKNKQHKYVQLYKGVHITTHYLSDI